MFRYLSLKLTRPSNYSVPLSYTHVRMYLFCPEGCAGLTPAILADPRTRKSNLECAQVLPSSRNLSNHHHPPRVNAPAPVHNPEICCDASS